MLYVTCIKLNKKIKQTLHIVLKTQLAKGQVGLGKACSYSLLVVISYSKRVTVSFIAPVRSIYRRRR